MQRFTHHPASVGESYTQHARFAFGVCRECLVIAGCAFAHALLPWVCEHTAGHRLQALARRLSNRSAA